MLGYRRAKIARAKHKRRRRPSVKMALRVGGGTRSATFENQFEFFRKESTREKYRYAFEIGKAERYLEYIKKWSSRLPEREQQRLIVENEEAYKKARSQVR